MKRLGPAAAVAAVSTKTAGAAVATSVGVSSAGATLVKLAVVFVAIAGLTGGGVTLVRGVSAEQAAPAPPALVSPSPPVPTVLLEEPVASQVPAEPPPAAAETSATVATTTFVPAPRPQRVPPPGGHEAAVGGPPEPRAVTSAAPPPADPLQGELGLVRAAHDALREGRPAVALERLDEHRRAYPGGALGEEREALRVGALCALGRTDAQAEARAFLANHPGSPFVARVREACLR